MDIFLGWNVDVGFWQWKKWFLDFFRSNDVDLDESHSEIKLNNEVTKNFLTSFRKM